MLMIEACLLVWERAIEHALSVSGAEFYDVDIAKYYVRIVASQPANVGGPLVKYAAMQVLAKLDAGQSACSLIRKLRADVKAAQAVKPPVSNTGVRSLDSTMKYHPDLVHYLKGY